jgi:hypothetical protein
MWGMETVDLLSNRHILPPEVVFLMSCDAYRVPEDVGDGDSGPAVQQTYPAP